MISLWNSKSVCTVALNNLTTVVHHDKDDQKREIELLGWHKSSNLKHIADYVDHQYQQHYPHMHSSVYHSTQILWKRFFLPLSALATEFTT